MSVCDALRIAKTLGKSITRHEMLCELDLIDLLFAKLAEIEVYALDQLIPEMRTIVGYLRADVEQWPETGGGEYGSSGAVTAEEHLKKWWAGFVLPFKP